MSGIFKYAMNAGKNTIGKKQGDFEPNILIAGVGIHKTQCELDFNPKTRETILIPNSEDSTKYRVLVNGELVEAPIQLIHGDRVLVGLHHYFLFVDPRLNAEETFEFEDALKEANKDAMAIVQQEQLVEEKFKQMEAKMKKEQEEREQ